MTDDKPTTIKTIEELSKLIRNKTIVTLREMEDEPYDMPTRGAYNSMMVLLDVEQKANENLRYRLLEEKKQDNYHRLYQALLKAPHLETK